MNCAANIDITPVRREPDLNVLRPSRSHPKRVLTPDRLKAKYQYSGPSR